MRHLLSALYNVDGNKEKMWIGARLSFSHARNAIGWFVEHDFVIEIRRLNTNGVPFQRGTAMAAVKFSSPGQRLTFKWENKHQIL